MRRATASLLLLLVIAAPLMAAGYKLQPRTIDAWNTYVQLTEKRIDSELNTPAAFLHMRSPGVGNIQIQPLTTKDKGKDIEVPDGTIHHWLGAVFIPNITLDKLIPWIQDYNHHSKFFKEVEESKLLSHPDPDTFDIFLRLSRSKLGVTAKFNTNHNVVFRRIGAGRISSKSIATKIAQIDKAGEPSEHELPVGDDSGYLWRLNSYWRYAERDGGVVVECETIGLSRPLGSWVSILNVLMLGRVKQIAESVARESLEDTLAAMRDGVKGAEKK